MLPLSLISLHSWGRVGESFILYFQTGKTRERKGEEERGIKNDKMRNTQFLSYLLHSSFFFSSGMFSFVCGASIDPAGDFICEVNFWALNKRWAAAESSGINQKLPSYRDRQNINVGKRHNPAAILTDYNVSRRKPHWLGILQNELSDSLLHQGSKGNSAIDRVRVTGSVLLLKS